MTSTPIPCVVALEGGGAKIVGHFAALQALKDAGLEIRGIAGTSSGAIAGTLFLAGVELKHIKEELQTGAYGPLVDRPRSSQSFKRIARLLLLGRPLLPEQTLRSLLEKLLVRANKPLHSTFEAIPQSVRIVCTSMTDRDVSVLGRDRTQDVVNSLLSSANIPLAFHNRQSIGLGHLIDGVFSSSLPTEFLDEIAMGAHKIALTFPNHPQSSTYRNTLEYIQSILGVLFSSQSKRLRREVSRGASDVEVITVDCEDIGTFDFSSAAKAFLEAPVTCPSGVTGNSYWRVYSDVLARAGTVKEDITVNRSLRMEEWRSASAYAARLDRLVPAPPTPASLRKYTLMRVRYTDIPEIESLQQSLESLCADVFKADYAIEKIPLSDTVRFDAFQRPELAISNEVVYTFPFFLSPVRRVNWGVIPYARHRAVGVLLSEKFAAETLKLIENSNIRPFQLEGLGKINLEWLMKLYSAARLAGGHVFAATGYMHNEIIPLIVRSTKQDDLQTNYLTVGRGILAPRVNPKTLEPVFEIEQDARGEIEEGKSALIFDLADKEATSKVFSDKCRMFMLPHGIAVPVGIGYSLVFAEGMLGLHGAVERWKALYQAASNTLRPVASKLTQAGLVYQE